MAETPIRAKVVAALAVILLTGMVLAPASMLGVELRFVEVPVIILALGAYRIAVQKLGARWFSGGRDMRAAEDGARVQAGDGPHGSQRLAR